MYDKVSTNLNFVLSIFLCKQFGPIGATIGTAISLLVANGLIMNIYYKKNCFINIGLFWKNIFCMSKFLIIPICFGMIYLLISKFSFQSFVVGIFAYTIIYITSYILLGMNKYERNLYISIFRAIINKKYDS